VDGVQVIGRMYGTVRSIHLLLASLALPFLVMYGISAVQMSHNGWFDMKPTVTEQTLTLPKSLSDSRWIAREVMDRVPAARGEVQNMQVTDQGTFIVRLVIPGTVHEVRYTPTSGVTTLKTSAGGVMVMLNRLHHMAGLSRSETSLNVWGWVVAIVSFALVLIGATGLWMWFLRRTERVFGAVLLALNLTFALVLIVLIRRGGP
jgi:hypothetical protein